MSTKLYLKSALVCLLLLAVTEGALALAKRRPEFFNLFSNQIPSREILEDRLRAEARGAKPLLVVLGDSVMYGSGLHAHAVPDWRGQTIPAFLRKALPGYTVVDLSMDGALPADYLALYQAVLPYKPAWIVLDLNYRMFSKKYQEGPEALSRPWLAGDLRKTAFAYSGFGLPADPVLGALRKYSLLFRYAEAFRSAFFFPSREETFNRWLKTILPAASLREPADPELLLQLKLKPYYYTAPLTPESASLRALRALQAQAAVVQQNVLTFFTPQNLEMIEPLSNPGVFKENVRQVDLTLAKSLGAKEHYENWIALYPSKAFYDHCHLTPAYNALLAQALARKILGDSGRADVQETLKRK